jgi:hypothetical protein
VTVWATDLLIPTSPASLPDRAAQHLWPPKIEMMFRMLSGGSPRAWRKSAAYFAQMIVSGLVVHQTVITAKAIVTAD